MAKNKLPANYLFVWSNKGLSAEVHKAMRLVRAGKLLGVHFAIGSDPREARKNLVSELSEVLECSLEDATQIVNKELKLKGGDRL